MDINTITGIIIPLAGIAGGFAAGRRGLSRQTIEMLQIQVDLLKEENTDKTGQITLLEGKVNILESLVTQKADVAEVKEIVNRIAVKVGA
jgi:hypothetical protein